MSASAFLGQIKQSWWTQDLSYDYDLFFLFVNSATLERLGQNNTQLSHFRFLVLVPSYWHQHWAKMCIGNNACGLSTPLLLCSRLSNNHTLQSFGHCPAQCAQLGSACLGSFLESKRLLYLLAPHPHLDRVFICILYASPHATPTWISHRAHQGFRHGNSSRFRFCVGRDDTHAFCILSIKLNCFQLS